MNKWPLIKGQYEWMQHASVCEREGERKGKGQLNTEAERERKMDRQTMTHTDREGD